MMDRSTRNERRLELLERLAVPLEEQRRNAGELEERLERISRAATSLGLSAAAREATARVSQARIGLDALAAELTNEIVAAGGEISGDRSLEDELSEIAARLDRSAE